MSPPDRDKSFVKNGAQSVGRQARNQFDLEVSTSLAVNPTDQSSTR
jgi:hypothetical protein